MNEYPYHPLANAYPLMEGAEFEAFCLNLSQEGLKLPIHLWRGQVIDGRNRQRACRLQHVDPVYLDDTDVVPEDRLEAHIASLNEHRRHLGEDFLRKRREERVARVVEKRREGKSTRQIAEEEGVSRAQVNRDLEQVQLDRGGPVEPADGKVTGKDKRKRTAKPRKAKPKDPASTDTGVSVEPPATNGIPPPGSTEYPSSVEPDPPPPDPGTDALGIPVPGPLAETFAAREAFARALSLRRKLVILINELAQTPGGIHLTRDLSRRESAGKVTYRSSQLDDLKTLLEGDTPHACVCPYCHGRHPGRVDPTCRACHGLAWVPLNVWRHVPPEEKAAVEFLACKESAS
jgi:hypothetical protein